MNIEGVGVVSRRNLVTNTVDNVLRVSVSVSSHQRQTVVELLLSLNGERVVVTVLTSVGDVVSVVQTLRSRPELTSSGLTGKGYTTLVLLHTQVLAHNAVHIHVVDTLQRNLNVAGELHIQCQSRLPSALHLQVLVQDGCTRGSCQIVGCLELTTVEVGQDILNVLVETGSIHTLSDLVVSCDVLSLQAVAVTSYRYDPYEGDTAGEDTGTTTQNVATIASDVPVETYAGSNVQTCLRHICGTVATVILVHCLELLVVVTLDAGVSRQLETQTCGQLEAVAERNLVLNVSRVLDVLECGIYLLQVVAVRVSDSECQRSNVATLSSSYEILPRVVYVVTQTTLHKAVLGVVVLELQTSDDVVLTSVVADLIGDNGSRYVTQVSVGEGVGTERSQQSLSLGAILVGDVLQNINSGEVVTYEATRLVLLRVGTTQSVGQTTVQETRVQLSSERSKVLLLEVTRALEVHSVIRSTTVAVTVVGVGVQRVHRRRRIRRILVLGGAETNVSAVVLVDVPVQASNQLPVGSAQRVTLVATRIVTELLHQELLHILHLSYSRTVVGSTATPSSSLIGASLTSRTRSLVHIVLEVSEEEQLVLNDRTTNANTGSVVDLLALVQALECTGLIGYTVVSTLQELVLIVVVNSCLELVGTTLGNSVDCTTGETALTNVKRGDRDRDLLQSVERNGGTTCGEATTDTECVVERCTIDSYIRLTVVTTTDSQTVRSARSLRSELHNVVHAAANAGSDSHTLARNAGHRTRTLAVHRRVSAVNSYNYCVHTDRLLFQSSVKYEVISQSSLQTLLLYGLVTQHLELHGVRTTGTYVQQAIVTVDIDNCAILCSRRSVNCNNGSTYQGLTIHVGNLTTDVRSRNLCRKRQSCENRQNQKGEFLHKKMV